MAFAFFRRKERSSKTGEPSTVYDAFTNGLSEMERRGADRVVLAVYKSEPNGNASGRWLTSDDTNYYPFEMLDGSEQEMIMDSNHYEVVALVRDDVGNVKKNPGSGVERYHRTRIHPILPALKPECELNYVTGGGVYTGEGLREFSRTAEKSGWTPEMIGEAVEAGIEAYRDKTVELMERGGVHDSLESMEKREYTPLEKLLVDMRRDIASSNCQ